MIPRSWLAGAALIALAASHSWVWSAATDRANVRHAAAVADLNAKLARLSAKHAEVTQAYLRERLALQGLQETLDNEARNDPDMDSNGLPASSVRRLGSIR